jgi:ABC-type transport system substrate-binding protein
MSVTPEARTPVGEIRIVDPSPLNWLFITWNTVEEPVRTDNDGNIVGAAMQDFRWIDDTTLEVDIRQGVRFQDGEALTAEHFLRSFVEVQRWKAPHPPGTYLNWHPDTTVEVVDDHKVRMHFPEPEGLALGKFRGMHVMNTRFWDELGYGYKKNGLTCWFRGSDHAA